MGVLQDYTIYRKEQISEEHIMYNTDFTKAEDLHIHFMGIGGISMSGLAELMLSMGASVSGSDQAPSPLTERLSEKGARIFYPQKAGNIPGGTDLVVMTAAIHPDNPELKDAEARNIPVLTRARFLGQVMKLYKMPVAVAGTHGKTTTTSMLAQIFLAAELDPTASIGGILPSIGGNFRIGGKDLFFLEACEYTNSFLEFFPRLAVILNIDADHLDFFKDIDDIRASFKKFASLLPEDGTLVINRDIPRLEEITEGLKCRVVTFGSGSDADYYPDSVSYDESGCPSFDLVHNEDVRHFSLSVHGEHNVYNACAACAAADILGIGYEETKAGLEEFKGTGRRFELKGEINGITIIDDYAHHPTEIKATLKAAKKLQNKRVVVVFQPHTYSRTKALLSEFAESLSLADEVILADIYAARETDTLGISSADLKEKVSAYNVPCTYIPSFEDIKKYILENCFNGDLLITMGAGDVVKIGDELLKK